MSMYMKLAHIGSRSHSDFLVCCDYCIMRKAIIIPVADNDNVLWRSARVPFSCCCTCRKACCYHAATLHGISLPAVILFWSSVCAPSLPAFMSALFGLTAHC